MNALVKRIVKDFIIIQKDLMLQILRQKMRRYILRYLRRMDSLGGEISDEEIVDRCILALVNEGAKILEEGVAQRASDMDIVYINGYGFPVWRGGPMFYANSLGLDKVLEKLKGFQEIDSDFWKPADLLEKLAKDELKFGEAPDINERKGKMKFPDIVGY